MTLPIHLIVNGRSTSVDVPTDETLLETLRMEFGLLGAREACGLGLCGACTVLADGLPVSSCIQFTWMAEGREILTIEGLDGEALHPVQQAFVDHNAFQCSYCTPGFILMALALLRETPMPSGDEIRFYLSGNLCRCGSYLKIEAAVADAAGRLAEQHDPSV